MPATRSVPFLRWADIVAPGLFTMQAIARWGNFFNQELYGSATTLPWGIPIECQYRVQDYVCANPPAASDLAMRFHPLFLYESISGVLGALTLIWIGYHLRKRLRPGDLFLRLPHLVRRRPVRARAAAPRELDLRRASPSPRSCRCCSSSRRSSSWPGATARTIRTTTRRRSRRSRPGARRVERSTSRRCPMPEAEPPSRSTSRTADRRPEVPERRRRPANRRRRPTEPTA